jgi:uncharacterized protein YcfJ
MKTKLWIRTTLGAVVVLLSMTAGTAFADRGYAVAKNRPDHGRYDYAKVLSSEPVIRYVTVAAPYKECWEETRRYAVENRPNTLGGTILGAVIGGVVGHQFGSGSGNDAATIAGTVIGGAVGNGISTRRAYSRGGYGKTWYERPVRRCETRYRKSREERIDGYRVVYRYHGQTYSTRMPNEPGRRIRIRVDIRPAHG